MISANLLARIGLDPGGKARQPGRVGKSIQDHVPHVGIGRELRLRVADEGRDLQVQLVACILIACDTVVRNLALVLVELRRIISINAVDVESLLHARDVGNLEVADETSGKEGQAARVRQDVRNISKWTILRRSIVDRPLCRQRIFNPNIISQVAAGDKVAEVTRGSSEHGAGLDPAETSTISADLAAIADGTRLRFEIDHARRSIAILRGERAGNQLDRTCYPRVEGGAKATDALGH